MSYPSTLRRYTTRQFLEVYGQGALDLAQALGDFDAWLAAYAEYGEEDGVAFDRCLDAEERLHAVIARLGLQGGISLDGRFVDFRDPDNFAIGHCLEQAWYRNRG
jgi:hypothetical protein